MSISTTGLAGMVALLAVSMPTPALAADPPIRGCASPLLDAPASGQQALEKIDDQVSTAAARSGLSTADLADALREDPTTWLDRCGRAFYVERAAHARTATPRARAATPQAATRALPAGVPVGQAFTLHSRPGSSRVVYLDFNGHLISETGWNTDFGKGKDIAAAPYDTDGKPAVFSPREREAVIEVFQRVAEDYAPFDVDVTTADPGQAAITRSGRSDSRFGTRALITDTSFACVGCAGIAYVGVFDNALDHAFTQPALAFSSALDGSAKLIAEVVSHEVGHTLGLGHDGTTTSDYSSGHGAWVPIMGEATNRPISQWSNGDYAGADNREDDLAVMVAGGAPLLADDHGDSAGTATPVDGQMSGVIGSRTDTDWFSLTTSGGPVTVSANPAVVGANLDLKVDLLTGDGTVVATSAPDASRTYADPPTGLGASISRDLEPGTYLVRVDGVGAGSPPGNGYSDYGSLGRYAFAVSAPAQDLPLAITTSVLPEATVGTSWSRSLKAIGGLAPYSWSVATGELPAGMVLSTKGRLEGTPTVTGTSTFTAQVTDGTTTVASAFTLIVRAPLAITTTTLPAGTARRPYLATLTGTGGKDPYRWHRAGGALPRGLTLTSTGQFSGTAKAGGTFRVTVLLTDPAGRRATRTLVLVVTK